MTDSPVNNLAQVNRQLLLAAAMLVTLVITLGVLASIIGMTGAVIAHGQVISQSNVKRIQHPTGGVVASIQVKDGSLVHINDVLITLDSTGSGANMAIVSDAIDSFSAQQSRLEAERDRRGSVNFSHLSASEAAVRARADELRLFQIHAAARAGEKAQLNERITQLREQVRGYQDVIQTKRKQIELIEAELVGMRQLFQENLVPLARLNALERDAAQLNGDIAQLGASAAEARGRISETELQIIQIDRAASSEAGSQVGEVQNKLQELKQKCVAAQQEFRRVQIRAPQDGVVEHLTVHTVGGVIQPGETIMLIVPDKDGVVVEAKIATTEVGRVHLGQQASLRFSAFDQRTSPEIPGLVYHVAADAQVDEKTGFAFYIVRIQIDSNKLAKAKMKVVPGMPVEVFMQTETRSMLSYLTKPLMDQARLVFRED